MKLNYDCLRKLLLVLEKELVMTEDLEYPDLRFCQVTSLMPDYSKADIAYTTIMAEEAGLINAHIVSADDAFCDCFYFSLTYDGHQFLDNIRDNGVWDKTKTVLGKIGGASLNVISSVAIKIVTSLLESKL